MDDGELVCCPVCSTFHLQADIEQHVQLHFVEDPPKQAEVVIEDSEEDDELVYCPQGCGALVRLQDLNSHEEAHRLQEHESEQLKVQEQDLQQQHELLQMKYGFSDKRPGKCFRCGVEGHWSRECPKNPAAAAVTAARNQGPLPTDPQQLVLLQQPDNNSEVHSVDIIPLLHACFDAQPKAHSMVYLSGSVGFHSGAQQADSGWGCGYRNIQMQISHLLMKQGVHRQALFGGCGYVPSVASLQAWLETAWQSGFDPGGAAMFGGAVQGTRKWVGTTEAAALLRHQGCRALLVEFHGRSPPTAVDASGATIHTDVGCDVCQQRPIIGVRYKSYQTPNYDVCARCRQSPEGTKHAPFRPIGQPGQQQRLNGHNSNCTAAAAAASGNGPRTLGQLWGAQSAGPAGGRQQQQQQRQQTQQQQQLCQQVPGNSSSRSSTSTENKTDKAERHRALAEWIWEYFSTSRTVTSQQQQQQAAAINGQPNTSGANCTAEAGSNSTAAAPSNHLSRIHSPVILTDRSPLYLQHEGHSRTVVGIERVLPPRARGGSAAAAAAAEYSLIILDPGLGGRELLNALRHQQGWQKLVKRGMHSLGRHAEFQVLYTTTEIVPAGAQRDALKKITAQDVYR